MRGHSLVLLTLLALVALVVVGCSGVPGETPAPEESDVALDADVEAQAAAPPTRWVATTGDDTGPGTQARPWRTLGHAAGVVVPGDVVLVEPGNYQGFYLERSGTQASRIIFRGKTPTGVVITQSNGRTPDGINIENCEWVTVQNFVVRGMPRAGIRAALADHVSILNCRCRDNNTWGIFTGFCNYLLVQGNLCSGSVREHGIYVSNSGDYPTVRYNRCHGNRGCGIHSNGDASAGGDGVISHARFEGNIIDDNGVAGGSGINCDGVTDSRIVNNLLYNNHGSGISLYRIDGGSGSVRNRVVNNTVVQASDGRWALNIRDGSTHNAVRNNILLHTLSYRGSIAISGDSRTGFTSDYNLCSGPFSIDGDSTAISLAQWQAQGYDAHTAIATAAQIFTNPSAHDYKPLSSGPAIDTGTSQYAPPLDLLKRPRPAGAVDDIGCYEGA